MIDESKLIFFTGAPGSKWSAVSNVLSMTKKININTTDRNEDREYTHPTKFNKAQHLGSYFGTGMEFGEGWHEINKFSKQEILNEIDKAWKEEKRTDYRIVKSHMISNNLDFIAETFPKSKIVIVFRPIESCYKGWFGEGGFDITYPKYHGYYKDEQTAREYIKEETKDARQWIFNRNLTIHTATSKHWKDYWDITDSQNRFIKSIEGYFFEKKDPSRDVSLDTHIAYYNFDKIDERL
jgi:hypothetical protein